MSAFKELSTCGKSIKITTLARPDVKVPHTHRINLFRDGKEQGTTFPLLLFVALKIIILNESGKKKETPSIKTKSALDQKVCKILRHLLVDINNLLKKEKINRREVLISKTLQEFVFESLLKGTLCSISHKEQLILNTTQNKSHTVSGMNNPSFTVPGYLCRYLLKEDGLNVNMDFNRLNPKLKRIGFKVMQELKKMPLNILKKEVNFSRCVQNMIMMEAFSKNLPSNFLKIKINNPVKV